MNALQNRPDLIAFVKSVAEAQGMQQCAIADVKTNEKGAGHLGEIFMITLREDSSAKTFNVLIKSAFTDEKVRKFVIIRPCFLNEIYFYTKIEPLFRKIESAHGISHTDFFPKCYKVNVENLKEVLCLENLKEINFEGFDKTSILDDEHIRFIFQTYGRFHAYTFALKDQEPEEYKNAVSKITNIYNEFINNPEGGFKVFLKSFNILLENVFKPGEDDEIIRKYQKYLGDGIVEAFQKAATELDDYSTILHGDCWSNNMLFKYQANDGNKKLVDIRLLDMQLIKVGSPACDLAYCFYSGASKVLFDNLDYYLNIYYESFSTFLRTLGSDPQKVFPFHILKEHWKKYAAFGMVMSFIIIKGKCTSIDDYKDMTDGLDENADENEIANMKFNKEEFSFRIKELLYHLSDIDAL